MSSLESNLFIHQVPSTTKIHPNTTWTALKSSSTPSGSHLLTADPFGAATHLWSVDKHGLNHLSSLQPPLPAGLVQIFLGSISDPPLFVVGFDDPRSGLGTLRLHDACREGEMVHELLLSHAFARQHKAFTFECSGELIAVSLSGSGNNLVQVFKYESNEQEGKKLKEVTRVSLPDEDHVAVAILCLLPDETVLTAHSAHPALHLSSYRGIHPELDPTPALRLSLTPSHESYDFLRPSCVEHISDSSLLLAVEESSSKDDHHPARTRSTVHVISLPSLSSTASITFLHVVHKLTQHPSLGGDAATAPVIVAVGSRHGPGTYQRTTIISFLSQERTGQLVLRGEVPVPIDDGGELIACRCTRTDELVLVSGAGRLSIAPIADVLSRGTAGMGAWRPSPVRPEPYNTKARKAGERWNWVERSLVITRHRAVVLFPVRGPEIYFVNW